MAPTTPQDAMKKITTQLKFGKKVSCHTLRHSFAAHAYETGVSLQTIQKWLGHSSLQITLQYLHITETAEAEARETIEWLFGDWLDYTALFDAAAEALRDVMKATRSTKDCVPGFFGVLQTTQCPSHPIASHHSLHATSTSTFDRRSESLKCFKC